MEGLLCLRDGEWLNADLIDAYLCQLCRRTPFHSFNDKENDNGTIIFSPDNIFQYIPTYGFLSYNNKKRIPAKWYWRFKGVETILAPAHMNNSHWSMAVVRIEKKEIVMMDSLNHGVAGSGNKDFMRTVL